MTYAIVTKVAATVLLASLAAGANATPIKDKGVKDFVSKFFPVIQQPQSKSSGPNLGTLISSLVKTIKIDFKEEKVKIAKVSFVPSFKEPDEEKIKEIKVKIVKIAGLIHAHHHKQSVPEPAPLLLIGGALLALGVYRRKLAPAA